MVPCPDFTGLLPFQWCFHVLTPEVIHGDFILQCVDVSMSRPGNDISAKTITRPPDELLSRLLQGTQKPKPKLSKACLP